MVPLRALCVLCGSMRDFRLPLPQHGVCFFKPPRHLLAFTGMFQQRLCVPLAARDSKEISAVNVDGAGEARDGIGDGVDDVAAKRLSVFFREGAGARGLSLARPRRHLPVANRNAGRNRLALRFPAPHPKGTKALLRSAIPH